MSFTFPKHRLGVFRGHRKPVLFVGFFSGWAVFALQLVYLWQIATCSWQQTFTLSSGGVAALCSAHLCSLEPGKICLFVFPAEVLKPVSRQCYWGFVEIPAPTTWARWRAVCVCAGARLVPPCMDLSIKQLATGCTPPTLQSQVMLFWCVPELSFYPPCLP